MVGRSLSVVFVLSVLGIGCSTTSFVSTWKKPDAGPFLLADQKVAVFVATTSGIRRQAEDVLAEEITARGADAHAGYRILEPSDLADETAAQQQLKARGFDAAVVMRPVETTQEVRTTPGNPWWDTPRYRSFGGYWGWGFRPMYAPPEVRTDTLVSVETLVYAVDNEELVWAGRTRTMNPSTVETFVRELARSLDERLRSDGLLR